MWQSSHHSHCPSGSTSSFSAVGTSTAHSTRSSLPSTQMLCHHLASIQHSWAYISLDPLTKQHNPSPVHLIVRYKSTFRNCLIWEKKKSPLLLTGQDPTVYFPWPKISQTPQEGPYLRMWLKRTIQHICVLFCCCFFSPDQHWLHWSEA